MKIHLEGCIDHEQIETPDGIIFRWPNPEHPGRMVETRDINLVPLRDEVRVKLNAATAAHQVACRAVGLDSTRHTAPVAGDPVHAAYREAFNREMAFHGYLIEGADPRHLRSIDGDTAEADIIKCLGYDFRQESR